MEIDWQADLNNSYANEIYNYIYPSRQMKSFHCFGALTTQYRSLVEETTCPLTLSLR